VVVPLAAGGGGVKRLMGKPRGEHRLTFRPHEITVEHGDALRAPLRFAPGSVVVASVDPGGASPGRRAVGRFPILHRLTADRVIPREEGIDGWMWTSADGTAFTLLGDDAPNLAFVFSPPLAGERIESAFAPDVLADLAKRSPLGQPAVFALLLRVDKPDVARDALTRYQLAGPITDREVPPVQRRHLPGDKPANPAIAVGEAPRAETSVPPPGMS
jgi:hypothetical protein